MIPQAEKSDSRTKFLVNGWMGDDILECSLKEKGARGEKAGEFHTIFVQIKGCENPYVYLGELAKWKVCLDDAKKPFLLIEGAPENPTAAETQQINKGAFRTPMELANGFLPNIFFPGDPSLEKRIQEAFLELLLETTELPMLKLQQRAVHILCWIRRYVPLLFGDGASKAYPLALFYNVRLSDDQTLFLRLLSRLPCDVMILLPDLGNPFDAADPALLKIQYEESLRSETFPDVAGGAAIRTVASQAEEEMTKVLFTDTGLYRKQQFQDAVPLILRTTYEEIGLLWRQEAKYRPGFDSLEDKVFVPVICAKIMGVPQANLRQYRELIRKMRTGSCFYIKRLPFFSERDLRGKLPALIRNGILQREKIRQHPFYPFKFLRKEKQDYILDSLQKLMDSRIIKDSPLQGAEYHILSGFMNLDIEFVKLVNNYDFTKEIPKILCFNGGESTGRIEDAVLFAFARQLGFDIALFVPTGYQCLETFFTGNFFTEHDIGEYRYNLPDLDISDGNSGGKTGILGKLFRW